MYIQCWFGCKCNRSSQIVWGKLMQTFQKSNFAFYIYSLKNTTFDPLITFQKIFFSERRNFILKVHRRIKNGGEKLVTMSNNKKMDFKIMIGTQCIMQPFK